MSREIEADLLHGLGQVVVEWASVEALLAEFLSFLLEANPGHMYVLNQTTSADTQSKWIRTLVEIRFSEPSALDGLSDLIDRIDSARLDRNALVHGLWSTECEPGAVIVQTIRLNRAEIARGELVTRSDLDDLIDRVKEVRSELFKVGRELGFLN